VTRLQADLIAVGCFSDVVDGIFGRATPDAVVLFQSTVGLAPDGIVGWHGGPRSPEATEEQSIDLSGPALKSFTVDLA
jgi:peptidoglycan hydrolase-like protein with peptidoglycan-binding domain